MQVIAKRNLYKGNYKFGELQDVTAKEPVFCCDQMQTAWHDRFIHFGETDSVLNRNTSVNIYKCNAWPEGASFEDMAINFCPFCAERMDVVVED